MNQSLTVFVVDDEQVMREFFSTAFPWPALDMCWIGEAGDGITALERCRELHPDLLLVDITMPGMNGLDLLATVKQEMPYVNSVLLTCHQEFAYVQSAMRNGAMDYLVKAATTPDELFAKLEDVRNRILEKRSTARLSTLQRDMLTRLLQSGDTSCNEGGISGLDYELQRLHFPLANAPCAVMWTMLQSRSGDADSDVQYADTLNDHRVHSLMEAFVSVCDQVMWAEPRTGKKDAGQVAIVTNLENESPFQRARMLLDRLTECVGDDFEVIAGVSNMAPNLFFLPEALKQARRALSARFYVEHERLLVAPPEWRSLAPEFESGFDSLAGATGTANETLYQGIDSLVSSAVETCREQGVGPEVARFIVLRLVQTHLQARGCRVSPWEQATWPMQIEHAATVSQVRQWAVQMVSMVLSQNKATKVRAEIQRVLVQLEERMTDPWDVAGMASVANLHPNYFSTVFKSEIGQSPGEYLARLRMNRAAQYLQERVWSMQQVANMVGIENYRTFYNTFCRIMGSSPTDFADRLDHLNS